MSAVATKISISTGVGAPRVDHPAPSLFEGDRITLEDVVLRTWEDLAVDGRARCPVCGDSMLPSGCNACGSELE